MVALARQRRALIRRLGGIFRATVDGFEPVVVAEIVDDTLRPDGTARVGFDCSYDSGREVTALTLKVDEEVVATAEIDGTYDGEGRYGVYVDSSPLPGDPFGVDIVAFDAS